MNNDEFDVIVVGAGLAGLCCAGELILQGKRPLLISETREVGAVFATRRFSDGSESFLQHINWQLGWGGGWWYQLARALNVPVRLHQGMDFAIQFEGLNEPITTPICISASALADVLSSQLPTLDRDDLERVLQIGLAIPHEELIDMQTIALSAWLEDLNATEMTTNLLLALCGQCHDLTVEQARGVLSVFGGLGIFRILLCGEGSLPIIYPHIRGGLCIPLAQAIEAQGGAVWRGRKVARIHTDADHPPLVVFTDDTEISAPNVAIATGNARIPTLLDAVPAEAQPALEYAGGVDVQDFNIYYLLRERVVTTDRTVTMLFDPTTLEMQQINLCPSGVAPWVTHPAKQIVVGHYAMPPSDVTKIGGEDAVYALMRERSEKVYPGLLDAVEETRTQSHRHHWLDPISIGPKLPRQAESVSGLWFVGDGSAPCRGIWTEAAASCGILGAREIAAT